MKNAVHYFLVLLSSLKCWLAEGVILILALVALQKGNTYGFYIFLRWAACPLFGWVAWKSFWRSSAAATALAVASGVLAVLYNPILRVTLDQNRWEVINMSMIAIALWSAVASLNEWRVDSALHVLALRLKWRSKWIDFTKGRSDSLLGVNSGVLAVLGIFLPVLVVSATILSLIDEKTGESGPMSFVIFIFVIVPMLFSAFCCCVAIICMLKFTLEFYVENFKKRRR